MAQYEYEYEYEYEALPFYYEAYGLTVDGFRRLLAVAGSKYEYLKDYEFAEVKGESLTPQQKAARDPLQGGCELSCLKLNLLYDGGFNIICDETTAYNEWPFCDGDPAKDDLFHMRQCVLTCRQPEGDEGCPNEHSRGNDKRGCEAGKAFKQGLPYEFVTKFGDTIIFQSLLTRAPTTTRQPTALPTTLQPTPLFSTPEPTTGQPTAVPSALPTASPTQLASTNATVENLMNATNVTQIGGASNSTNPQGNSTFSPSLSPTWMSPSTKVPTVLNSGHQLRSQDYILIALGIVGFVVFFALLACILYKRRRDTEEAAQDEPETGVVEEVVRETERALS